MIAPMNDQLQDTAQPAPADDHGRGRRYQACRAVNAFLREVLTKGPVAVIELEQRARKVRLLGGRQRITDAKAFKRAKKLLGVQSKRGGFGRGGEWFWELSIRSSTLVADTTANTAPKTQVSVAYVEDHSRPEPCSSREPTVRSTSDSPPTEKTRSHRFPLEWEKGVERLHHRRQHAGIPPHRWHLFVDDCAKFLDSHDSWAGRAAELGWDALALFGCDRNRPLDQPGAGLLWRLSGGRLLAIYKDWAAIAGTDGTQRVFHRRPGTTNVTLPWLLR
jgi:hypothetical protein